MPLMWNITGVIGHPRVHATPATSFVTLGLPTKSLKTIDTTTGNVDIPAKQQPKFQGT